MSVLKTLRAGITEISSLAKDRKSDWDKKREVRRLEKHTGRRRWVPYVLLLLLAVAYSIIVGRSLSIAYIDLGDGNYLYTSSRMADGLTIYRDFLSPQPPMHLLTGSLLIRLGRLLEKTVAYPALMVVPVPLLTVRVFSMALHLLTMGLIFLIGRRLTQSAYGGVVAALLYLLLPFGFWWSLGYQSELLEIFFLMGALWFFLPLEPRRMAAAGALMALAVLTNMTAAPYALALLAYLVIRHGLTGGTEGRRLTLYYLAPLVALLAGVVGYYQLHTGAYFQNVISNQMASYHPGGFRGYGFPKLIEMTAEVLVREGGFIILALLGLLLYNRTDTRQEREFLVWYALVLLLSIAYVTKGGTMNYIFTLGEPVLALFGAYYLTQFFYPSTMRRFFQRNFWRDTSVVPQVLFILILAFAAVYPGYYFMRESLKHQTFELDVPGVERVAAIIHKHSKEGDRILAPPYYAFLTRRLLVAEHSEQFLWDMKYAAERKAKTPGEGVERARVIERALRERRVPLAILDGTWDYGKKEWRPGRTLWNPEVVGAINAFYKPLLKDNELIRTLNTQLQAFIPKTDEELQPAGKEGG